MGKIVDISYHNEENAKIDFAKLSKEVDFVIIRVQYGSKKIDSSYLWYVQQCQKYGIPYGFYAYGCYVSVADAIVESNDFYDRTVGKGGQFLVLDTEDDTLSSCGAANLAKASQAFIDNLKAKGVSKVGFYTSHNFLVGDPYKLQSVKADFRWIPRYGVNDGQVHTNSKPAFDCDLWQYTENGTAAGITGLVDLNVLNGSKPLEYFTGKSNGGGIIGVIKIKVPVLNIRAEASTSSAIIGKAYADQTYNVTANNGQGWHQILLDNKGNKGWVYSDNGVNFDRIK